MPNWLTHKATWLGITFAAACAIGVAFEFYYLFALPAVLAISLLTLYRYDYIIAFIVLTTPFSFNFEDLAIGGVGFFFPTEPLLFGLLLLFILQSFRKSPISKVILDHPISIAIILHVFWLVVTTYTSQMPIVSLKFLTARLWFIAIMYFMTLQIFKTEGKIKQYLWLYLVPLTIVVIYTVLNHATYNFAHEPAHYVMWPFYKDHTSYGAVLAMYFPVALIMLITGKHSVKVKGLLITIVGILAIGLILSYTRAAWVSLLGAGAIFLVMHFKIPFKWLLGAGVVVIGLFFVYQDQLLQNLERNNQDSSDNLSEHVESISNISSDASNLERLNRWSCALRMFADKPIFGFGPGTYMFQYAPYQKASEKTIISTNQGDVGNAHSEYLGPLSETGLFGPLIFLVMIGLVLAKGIKLYSTMPKSEMRYILMGILLGLITYLIHGILNNYLDTDKASIPFWSFIASIAAIDIWHKNQGTTSIEE